MPAGGTLAPVHCRALFGRTIRCCIVRSKRSTFRSFQLACANSTARKRSRLNLYPGTLADPLYRIVKELSQSGQVYASWRAKCAKFKNTPRPSAHEGLTNYAKATQPPMASRASILQRGALTFEKSWNLSCRWYDRALLARRAPPRRQRICPGCRKLAPR